MPPRRRTTNEERVVMKPTDSQWEAIRATDEHVLVAASAGTGKTHTVVGRILYALGEEIRGERCPSPLRLDQIAAITFTNQAAADLKEKLREKLRTAGRTHEVHELDAARIGTIHSFCGEVLRECALRTGRALGASILEDGEANALASECVRETLIAALEESSVDGLPDLLAEYDVEKVQG